MNEHSRPLNDNISASTGNRRDIIYWMTILVWERNKKSTILVLLITKEITLVRSEIHLKTRVFAACGR